MANTVYVWAVATYTNAVMENEVEKEIVYHKPIRFSGLRELICQIEACGANRITLTGTKKDAEEWAADWNRCAKRNKNHMWDYKESEYLY